MQNNNEANVNWNSRTADPVPPVDDGPEDNFGGWRSLAAGG